MQKEFGALWRGLGRAEKTFFFLLVAYAFLYFSRLAPLLQSLIGVLAFIAGLVVLFRVARRTMRKAIWRLRNRLIAAYIFIAVGPIILILAMGVLAGWVVIGQMAVYLVNKELEHRETTLVRQADAFANLPMTDPAATLNRFARITRNAFPDFEMLISGEHEVRYPPDARITAPPREWKHTSGLILKNEGGERRLYAWAHVPGGREEVTILAPITHELLTGLVPGLGDVTFYPLMGRSRSSQVPARKNWLDFEFNGIYPVM